MRPLWKENKRATNSSAQQTAYLQLRTFQRYSFTLLTENHDYKIIEAPSSQTKVMLYNKLTLGNALTNSNNEKYIGYSIN